MQRDTIMPGAQSLARSLENLEDHREDLERIFNTISGLTKILEEDALRAADPDDPISSVFNHFHRGVLHDAIDQVTILGYQELWRIERLIRNIPRGQEVSDERR